VKYSGTYMKHNNPFVYVEIPVNDMQRAIRFYETVFDMKLTTTIIDNIEMALFPFDEGKSGITGALAKGEIYKPTIDGVLIYLHTDDIDLTLERVIELGGEILYPKTDNGIGFVAEFQDLEGNRIALFQKYL
jgi:predicted enzyme related to lactoylglutathione lyase